VRGPSALQGNGRAAADGNLLVPATAPEPRLDPSPLRHRDPGRATDLNWIGVDGLIAGFRPRHQNVFTGHLHPV
jgi:hypothetical protein